MTRMGGDFLTEGNGENGEGMFTAEDAEHAEACGG